MGSSVQIDFGDEIVEHPCECCGRSIRSGQASVLDGDDPVALYWFDLHRNGDDRRTRLLVALAPIASGRRRAGISFVAHGWATPGGLAWSLADKADSPVVPQRRVTGRTLSRRQALKHPDLPRLWQLIEELVEHDPALATFFNTEHS